MSLIDQALQKAYQQRLRPVAVEPLAAGMSPVAETATSSIGRELYVHSAEPPRGRHFRGPHRLAVRMPDAPLETSHRLAGLHADPADIARDSGKDAPVNGTVAEGATAARSANVGATPLPKAYELSGESRVETSAFAGVGAGEGSGLEWMPFPVSGSASSNPASLEPCTSDHQGAETARIDFKPAWEVDAFQFSAAVAKAGERLLTRLREALGELVATKAQVVWVGSLLEGEGRTTVASLLASALAGMGQKVLLIQGDARGESLAKQLGIACELGWNGTDTDSSLEDQCLYSLKDQFTLLAASNQGMAADARFASNLSATIARLVPFFDHVVVDVAAGMSHRSLSIPGASEMEVVVQDTRRTSTDNLQKAVWAMPLAKYREVRVVQNFV